ncbi:MAG: hypothetical protein GY906_34250 [bacterium]|nr:hypothetical protein [bacterium]
MQTVSVKGRDFSKVVLGTNAIYGRSHFSDARSKEYEQRCTDDYITRLIEMCMKFGVNTVESSANERISRLMSELEHKHSQRLRFIGNTRKDKTSAMGHQEKFDSLIASEADICVVHAQFVDRPRRSDTIGGLQRLVDQIHAAGLLAGISTHRISTVELCEEQDYGIDAYLFPLNETGFVYPGYDGNETPTQRIETIKNTPKPFVLMKTLGAGRIPPADGLAFALDNSKESDIITLGLGSIEEAEESLSLACELLGEPK